MSSRQAVSQPAPGAQWERWHSRQPVGDLYDELGVAADATREEIASAYRVRAKELHPDARPGEPEAAERFRPGTAYRVLPDRLPRPVRRGDARTVPTAGAVDTAAAGSLRLCPEARRVSAGRGARWCVGVVRRSWSSDCSPVLVFSLQQRDADLRANGVAAAAPLVRLTENAGWVPRPRTDGSCTHGDRLGKEKGRSRRPRPARCDHNRPRHPPSPRRPTRATRAGHAPGWSGRRRSSAAGPSPGPPPPPPPALPRPERYRHDRVHRISFRIDMQISV